MTIKIVKFMFFLYQGVTRSQNATCRFMPTCSQYAIEAIEKHGAVVGSGKAIMRLLSCHPFSKRPIYDPIT